jgi:hypothetical protein
MVLGTWRRLLQAVSFTWRAANALGGKASVSYWAVVADVASRCGTFTVHQAGYQREE